MPPDPEPFEVVAPPDAEGERTDRFLARSIGTLSRSRVKSLMVEGAVEADGRVLRDPDHPVRAGTRFVLRPPAPVAARPAAQPIPFDLLHEDEALLVLDKPAGLVVHPAPGNEDGTLVNALLAHCGDGLPGIGGEKRPGIVHRLDKDTSGVMVVAKTEAALAALSADFAARRVERQYLALSWGCPVPQRGQVEGAIGRDPRDRKRMAVVRNGGKPALTHYETLEGFGNAVGLLGLRLATGRTHQIRVHMAMVGHPLVGDPVYLRRVPAAAKALPPALRGALLDFPRQALHAATLGFTHPATGRAMRFERPLPADMAGLLGALRAWEP